MGRPQPAGRDDARTVARTAKQDLLGLILALPVSMVALAGEGPRTTGISCGHRIQERLRGFLE